MEWYRDNGVLKVRRSSKSSSAPKSSRPVGKATGVSYLGSGYGSRPTSGPAIKTTTGTGARKVSVPKPSDYEAKRENGIFRGFQKTQAAKAAAERRANSKKASAPKPMATPTAGTIGKEVAKAKIMNGGKELKRAEIVKAAKRRDRQARIKSGDFKGKYYGPDAFKGNTAKIDAWKKAGKPDVKKFLNK